MDYGFVLFVCTPMLLVAGLIGFATGASVVESAERRKSNERFENVSEAINAGWERDAIRHGFGQYEQYLDRDGMQTRFAWIKPPTKEPPV